jgi:hypothetical protein
VGHRWLTVDGPFNEHLVRDVGTLYLALLALSVGAAVTGNPPTVRLTAVAWLVFSVPHLAYHLAHLDGYSPVDKMLNVVALGATVLLPAMLLPVRRLRVEATQAARRASGTELEGKTR